MYDYHLVQSCKWQKVYRNVKFVVKESQGDCESKIHKLRLATSVRDAIIQLKDGKIAQAVTVQETSVIYVMSSDALGLGHSLQSHA